MGWDGDEAISGLNKLADATQKTGAEIDQLAIKQKRAAAEQKAFEKRLESMNALERQQAVLARETKQRRMGMSAEAIQKEDAYNALKARLAGMNALEREEFKAAERKKARLMGMTAAQIKAEAEAERRQKEQQKAQNQKAASFESLKEKLRGMNALERENFKNQEREKKRLAGMSAAEIVKDAADKQAVKEKAASFESLKEKLRGMNALEREQFKAAERERKMLSAMSAPQIRAYQEAQAQKKQQAAAEETRRKQLLGMNALEREKLLADEKTKARRMSMTARQVESDIRAEEKAAEKKRALEEWRKKSTFQKLATVTSGAADIRAAGGMMLGVAGGIANGAVQFAQMGAELESMQIRAAYLAGSFAKGTKAIEDMRQASMASGVALKENIAAMSGLANAGISMETAAKTVMQVQGAAELLGEQGAATISSSIAGMFKAGTAGAGELDALQSQGMKVYESLATVLEQTTGKAHSLEEAMAAVREGLVSSAEGVRAVMIAANGKDMQDAAARFAGSFEGQVRRLKATMEDTFREISKMFLDSFDVTSIAAGLRGAFMAVRDIVKEISATFLPLIDPKDKAQGVENTFKAMRNIVYDLAERLAKAVIDLRQAFETLLPIIEANINKFMKRMEYGVSGIFAGEEINRFYESEDAVARMKGRGAATRADAAKAGIDQFFGKVRNDAAARDAANIAKPTQAVADSFKPLEKKVSEATLALETMAKSTNKFATDALAQMRTPYEQFNKEIGGLARTFDEAQRSLMGGAITQAEFAKFREAANRKGGKLLQDLIANNIGGESQFSSASVRGSAADVEMRVRAQYGEETMSIQEKIRIATERAAFNSDKQLAYSDQLVKAFERTKAPPVAAIGK